MKPKFNIPIQASRREIDALIKMYAERLYREHSDDTVTISEWMRWNVERLSELVTVLGKAK